jgi:hypothetical protein
MPRPRPAQRSSNAAVTSTTPGVDVMITIFGDFCQFWAIKLAFFSKSNVMIKNLHNLALFGVKNSNFFAIFFAKIFLKS